MIDHRAAAQRATRLLDVNSMTGGKPVLLVGNEDDRRATLQALEAITGSESVNLNLELAQALIDAAGSRLDPATAIVDINPIATPLLLDRIQILTLPQLRINVLDVLIRVARRRSLCVSWPGRVDNGRLRYANHNHPEYLDEDASRALVLDLSINEGTNR